jgi:hypothetical protein
LRDEHVSVAAEEGHEPTLSTKMTRKSLLSLPGNQTFPFPPFVSSASLRLRTSSSNSLSRSSPSSPSTAITGGGDFARSGNAGELVPSESAGGEVGRAALEGPGEVTGVVRLAVAAWNEGSRRPVLTESRLLDGPPCGGVVVEAVDRLRSRLGVGRPAMNISG